MDVDFQFPNLDPNFLVDFFRGLDLTHIHLSLYSICCSIYEQVTFMSEISDASVTDECFARIGLLGNPSVCIIYTS
jgi:hypothetical protein